MERFGEETHVTTEEARGGATPHMARYALAFGLILAIILLTIIWVTGAWTSSRTSDDTVNGIPTVSATK